MARTVLIVPGLRGSGPSHWQSLWQAQHPEYVRVLQQDWGAPRLDAWAAAIGLSSQGKHDVLVVAHGFGCLAAIRFFAKHPAAGALLVAPRDPQDFGMDAGSLDELGFPSILVASRNDPDMPFRRAKQLASRLGSRCVDAGEAGHIDAAAGYGPWPLGERLLVRLAQSAEARERELRVAVALGT